MSSLQGLRVGFGITGSYCTHRTILDTMKSLCEMGADVTPIFSDNVSKTSTRFMEAEELRKSVMDITGKEPICTIKDAEPIGPKGLLDVMTVVPCTGNTIAKLAGAITDTPVLMACKSHMRNNRPVILAVSTNDALSGNAKNIGALLGTKNFYFVPMKQDDPFKKPFSVVADFTKLNDTIVSAISGTQIQPIFI